MGDTSNTPKLPQVQRGPPALLYEMMRSFTALARVLNLTQAVEELNSTRQTVKRHISQLEEAMGAKLFDVEQRRYVLTDFGQRALEPAELLLDQGKIWYTGSFQHVGGLLRFAFASETGSQYFQQQLPITSIWQGESGLLKAAVKAWSMSEGKLESQQMAQVRPYLLVFRENSEGWICTEVGEESFYSNWYGWAQARSSVGLNLNSFQGGKEFASLADRPFRDVAATHGIRLDQLMVQSVSPEDGAVNTVMFDRLLMGVRMPDESPAVISVVDRSRVVQIAGLNGDILEKIPPRAKIDFSL
tara:strand:+ start:508 stop:1410 length:903 start_codon:yes stop_codon:yes gene_type:complete